MWQAVAISFDWHRRGSPGSPTPWADPEVSQVSRRPASSFVKDSLVGHEKIVKGRLQGKSSSSNIRIIIVKF